MKYDPNRNPLIRRLGWLESHSRYLVSSLERSSFQLEKRLGEIDAEIPALRLLDDAQLKSLMDASQYPRNALALAVIERHASHSDIPATTQAELAEALPGLISTDASIRTAARTTIWDVRIRAEMGYADEFFVSAVRLVEARPAVESVPQKIEEFRFLARDLHTFPQALCDGDYSPVLLKRREAGWLKYATALKARLSPLIMDLAVEMRRAKIDSRPLLAYLNFWNYTHIHKGSSLKGEIAIALSALEVAVRLEDESAADHTGRPPVEPGRLVLVQTPETRAIMDAINGAEEPGAGAEVLTDAEVEAIAAYRGAKPTDFKPPSFFPYSNMRQLAREHAIPTRPSKKNPEWRTYQVGPTIRAIPYRFPRPADIRPAQANTA